MSLNVQLLPLAGVILLMPTRITDSRGYFAETYSKRNFSELPVGVFVQDNEAFSMQRGTVRGLHFQISPKPQAKLVRVVKGSVFDVAVDLREGSLTYGKWCGATLSAADGNQLFIPRGFAHAYCTLEPETILAYKVDGFYDKSSERGVRFNDPDVGVDWPLPEAEMIVSEKDASLPMLRDAETPFRFGS